MIASIWTMLIPLWILLFFVVLLGVFALLSRIAGGRYLRPVVVGISKVPLLRRLLTKASEAAIRRENPTLASAIKKMEHLEKSGALRDPQRLQKALGLLTPAERRAWMDAARQQEQMPEAANRQIRRQLERPGLGLGKSTGKGRSKSKGRNKSTSKGNPKAKAKGKDSKSKDKPERQGLLRRRAR